MRRIPFERDEFGWEQLEEFVRMFLNSAKLPPALASGTADPERLILSAVRYGKGGDKQNGIDILAKVEGGTCWSFQCKLWKDGTKRWGLSESKAAVKANVHPFADRHFLVVISTRGCTPAAIDHVNLLPSWTFWDADTLSDMFFDLDRVSVANGTRILNSIFRGDVAKELYGSLHDAALVTGDRYFEVTPSLDHSQELVGRQPVLDALNAFASSPDSAKAYLLVGRGGEGKSRILKQFADEFATRHPGAELRFVSHSAPPEEEERTFDLLPQDQPLIVVHEDAHRMESLRPRVLAAVVRRPHSKIILSVRPQSVEPLRHRLIQAGFHSDRIVGGEPLPRMTDDEMHALAREVLRGHAGRPSPERLVQWSDRCPLITVVGAKLIREGLAWSKVRDAVEFRHLVFRRFEDDNLDLLAAQDGPLKEELRQILRTSAILAPYPDTPDDLNTLAAFLELRGAVLEDRLSRLKAAELMVKTGQGWRVVPDLFSDHLVYQACVTDGMRSLRVKELIDAFGSRHWPVLMRNLAEAEWHGRQTQADGLDLTSELWKAFRLGFQEAGHFARARLLETWSPFAIFLPERSIDLARLAMAAPLPSSHSAAVDEWVKPFDNQTEVLHQLPAILGPIATHYRAQQEVALDLLTELGRDWSGPGLRSIARKSHPWAEIGEVAAFAHGKSLHVIKGVLDWLRSRWSAGDLDLLIDERSDFLPLVLRRVFDRSYFHTWFQEDTTQMQEDTMQMRSLVAVGTNTFLLRSEVIELLSQISMRHEEAALNVLTVLDDTLRGIRGVDGELSPDTLARLETGWAAIRRQSLEVVSAIIERWKHPVVQFAAFHSLRRNLHRENDRAFAKAVRSVIAATSKGLEFDLARVTLGHQEPTLLDHERGAAQWNWDDQVHQWKSLARQVAQELLRHHHGIPDLLEFLAGFEDEARRLGYSPSWSLILSCFLSEDPERVGEWALRISAGEAAYLERYYMMFVCGDDSQDRWLAEGLRSERTQIRESVLRGVAILRESPGPETESAMVEMLAADDLPPEKVSVAIETMGRALENGESWFWTFLPRLDLERMSTANVLALVQGMSKALAADPERVRELPLRTILNQLVPVEDVNEAGIGNFMYHGADHAPLLVCEFFEQRIAYREAKDVTRYLPVPSQVAHRISFASLHRSAEFHATARRLLDRVRHVDGPTKVSWETLFTAVVLPTPFGISLLREWLDATDDENQVERIVDLVRFEGSMAIFENPDFVRAILVKTRRLSGERARIIEARLRVPGGHRIWLNGEQESPRCDILKHARAASARHAADPVLRRFYEEVERDERAEQERQRRWYRARHLE